jgi:uncharacterized phage protein gp47/JayE
MAFVKKGFAQLYGSLETDARQRLPQLSDFQEGSVIRSLFESFAVEMTILYEQLDLVYQAGFIDTAEGAQLDRVVAILGIKRNEPDFAAGQVTFTRDPGSREALTIPLGTLVTTIDDERQGLVKKAYLTLEEAHLAVGQNQVEVKVQATVRGRQMVTSAATIVVMPRPQPGVKSVDNTQAIHFLGRDRETDEELRQRAKQGLLASGRASGTALEMALLSMPDVRAVRIKEEASRPGVVQIYVDGLNERNRESLTARVDEVRAAGIYVALEPAQPINLTLTLRITLAAQVKGEEQVALESRISEAVETFINRLPMGQALLFSQLTAEVLKFKGVIDLEDFRVEAARPTLLQGEQTTEYTAAARRIEADLHERFMPVQVRVAASIKPLPVDVQVQVSFPSHHLRTLLATTYQDNLAAQQTASHTDNATLSVLSTATQASINTELQYFYTEARSAAAQLDWSAALDTSLQARLVTTIQDYFSAIQQANPQGGGRIVAREILARLQQMLTTGTPGASWRERLQTQLTQRLRTFHQNVMTGFPEQTLATLLDAGARLDYQAAVQQAQNQQQTAIEAAEEQFRTLTGNLNPADKAYQEQLAAAQDTLRAQQQAATDAFTVAEAAAAAALAVALNLIQTQVEALRQQLYASLESLVSDAAWSALLPASATPSPYDVAVRLQALLFDTTCLTDVPHIEASFVERPEPGKLLIDTSPDTQADDANRGSGTVANVGSEP